MHTYDPHGEDDLSLPTEDSQLPVQPVPAASSNPAAGAIRRKLSHLYAQEPDATRELAEAAAVSQRSPHQQFMYQLSSSGKDLAAIQTEWHRYYQALPDAEKHAVWQEFYGSQALVTHPSPANPQNQDHAQVLAEHKHHASGPRSPVVKQAKAPRWREARSKKEIQAAIRHHVTAGGQLEVKHHVQSLLFGLGMGFIVLIIFLFGFFNEVILAPFIQPSRATASTPLIVSGTQAPSDKPEVIIPKINVEIPADYTQTSINESIIEGALENGIVHYPTTVFPGQTGNAAYFGHSSNNIFNKGKYKFAFVLLHTLVNGDTFYLTYHDQVYVYKVISRTIVDPSQVGVLGPVPGQTATATLITCDPPGTSLRRLVVVGQQITPDPAGNTPAVAPSSNPAVRRPAALPGNGPTLWGRLLDSSAGKVGVVIVVVGLGLLLLRRLNGPPASSSQ